MKDIYNEIEPLSVNLSHKSIDELIYDLSYEFNEIRNAVRKSHFGENSDLRQRAINAAACCIAIVESLDEKKKG